MCLFSNKYCSWDKVRSDSSTLTRVTDNISFLEAAELLGYDSDASFMLTIKMAKDIPTTKK